MKKIALFIICVMLCVGCTTSNSYEKHKSEAVQASNDYRKFTYHRDSLSKHEQETYDMLYYHMRNRDETYSIIADNDKQLIQIYENVLNDHPEIYWYGESNLTYYEMAVNDRFQYDIKANLPFKEEAFQSYDKQLKDITQSIIKKLNTLPTDYEKVKYVFDYIIDHTKYNETTSQNQNILSVFIYKNSVCAGYAKSVQYLLNEAGISCTYLTGKVKDTQDLHAWNLVKMDQEYYYLDATNGDTESDIDKRIRYAYFAFSSEQMLRLYEPEGPYEQTLAYQNNYFAQNQAYITSTDISNIQPLLNQSVEDESHNIIFQCNTKKTCQLMKQALEQDDTIFNMMLAAGFESKRYTQYMIDEANVMLYQMEE